jgi:hypothetical protein
LRAGHHEEYAATVLRAFAPIGSGLLVLACQWHGVSAEPARPSALAAGDPCASEVDDQGLRAAAQLEELPEQVGDWCLDRLAPPASYGELGEQSLERACERVLGPGCRAQEGATIRRVVRFHYIRRSDPSASADGVLSRFREASAAYARYTRAVLGDGDPEHANASELDAGRLAQRGDSLFAWQGRELLWLQQVDERSTAARRQQRASESLPPLARALLARLGDPDALPASVQRLPEAARVPLGLRLFLDESFGVAGLGPSALGYYRQGDERWRMVASARPDAESAKDLMSTLEHQPDAHRLERASLEALTLSDRHRPGEPPLSWLIARQGNVVYGVGSEEPSAQLGGEPGSVLTLQQKISKLLGAQAQ